MITEIAATGSLPKGGASGTGVKRNIKGFVLTPGAAAAGNAVIRDGGAGGTVKMTLNAANNGTSAYVGFPAGEKFNTDCHVTLTGAGAILYAIE